MKNKPLYERAREGGQEFAARVRSGRTEDMTAFYCWASRQPEFRGLEAAWRQFAIGVDPANAKWAEDDR